MTFHPRSPVAPSGWVEGRAWGGTPYGDRQAPWARGSAISTRFTRDRTTLDFDGSQTAVTVRKATEQAIETGLQSGAPTGPFGIDKLSS